MLKASDHGGFFIYLWFPMLKDFIQYIRNEKLCTPGDSILLAVSGGVDSVVMCELFSRSDLNFAVAHCNFQLRNAESEEDCLFVAKLAKKYKVPFHTATFNTADYSKKNKLSIQVAARNQRYDWFEQIRNKEGYSYIATAHHRDDSIETFFINLIRGTGISGLHGILPQQGKLIRPLLFTTKEEIVSYALKNKLKFREDSSNASDKYLRNKIRHSVVPVLKELNPMFDSVLSQNIQHLRDVEKIFRKEIQNKQKELLIIKDKETQIAVKALQQLDPIETYLFEILRPYNFNSSICQKIAASLNKDSGKQFFSSTHRLIKDRDKLIIQEITNVTISDKTTTLKKDQKKIQIDTLRLSFKKLRAGTKFSHSSLQAALDLDKLRFPLTVRKWKHGDTFQPLGMKGKKKLSDFFIDKKLSLSEKENVWLLLSGDDIAWVIGYRIDDRFKITDETKKIYFAELAE
ncbi:MAG: tilS [Bacteroidetes bacterium]|jgi:tRNA(Ile)-lysidine synthase|nr:tilS [Bacteroidota bacterium]